MRLRVLNDFLIVEPETSLVPIDASTNVINAVKSGLLHLPEHNSLMKISPFATVVACGSKCKYKDYLQTGTRIWYDQFADSPVWTSDEKKYRIIKEWYVKAVFE